MPLYLSRCATVLSLQQLLDEASDEKHSGAHVMESVPELTDNMSLPIMECSKARLSRYRFPLKAQVSKVHRISSVCSMDDAQCVPNIDDESMGSNTASDEDDVASSMGSILEPGTVPQKSLLDAMLLALWEDCAEQGLFRYDVTACPTKVLPGIYGFVAQLNEGRATKKRATEFRVDQVCQPFDHAKFHFGKAQMKEVLFTFEPSHGSTPQFEERVRCARSPNAVLINVSPIEYGHVLLVPRVLDCLSQLVDPGTVLLALHFAREAANPYFRVGYNSFGAFATINHLHFQAYYLAAPLPCERAETSPVMSYKRKGCSVTISRTTDFPVRCFVLEVGNSLEEMAALVGEACIKLQQANIAHNLLICDGGSRVFLFPQCYAEKQARGLVSEELLDTGVNPACWEIAGHMVMKRAEDYEAFSQDLAWRLLAECSLDEQRFVQVAEMCFNADLQSTAAAAAAAAAAAGGVPAGKVV